MVSATLQCHSVQLVQCMHVYAYTHLATPMRSTPWTFDLAGGAPILSHHMLHMQGAVMPDVQPAEPKCSHHAVNDTSIGVTLKIL